MTLFLSAGMLLRNVTIFLAVAHLFITDLAQCAPGPRGRKGSDELHMRTLLKRLTLESQPESKTGLRAMYPAPRSENGLAIRAQWEVMDGMDDPIRAPDVSCDDTEWYVIIRETPACISPLWTIGYDPYFCSKMSNGLVYCGCDDGNLPGVKEGIDTCIKTADATRPDRCSLSPCPPNATCKDTVPGFRYDCIKGEVVVPSFYGDEY